MGTLTNCLKIAGDNISKEDAGLIRQIASEYDDRPKKDGAIQATRDVIVIAESDRAELVKQIEAAGGTVKPNRQEKMNETATDALKSAASHGVKGVDEALTGLANLFGGKSKFSSGFTFDEDTYASAKPHFKKALEEFVAAKNSIADFVKFIIENFGPGIKPYLSKFHKDVKAGSIQIVGINAKPTGEENVSTDSTGNNQGEKTGDGRKNGAMGEKGVGTDGQGDLFGNNEGGKVEQQGQKPNEADAKNQGGRGNGKRNSDSTKSGGDRSPVVPADSNYRITDADNLGMGGAKTKAKQNIRAIEIIKQLKREGRNATAEEQAELVKYVGWGMSEIANGMFPVKGRPKKGWKELSDKLKSLLTEEEYKEAARTTQYAHFTSPSAINSIYYGLDRLGFKYGAVMEPGMGSGNFNGLMPGSVAKQSTYMGVEYDGITAQIAQQLYPESSIHKADFTKFDVMQDHYDLTIGNVPFASTIIKSDPRYKKHGFNLHEYFFAKSIDSTRPGGMMVFITSRYLMDRAGAKAREYLQERADLVGAIRLPQTAFKANAGTEVVTDIIFLRKKVPGETLESAQNWSSLNEIKTPEGPATINEYYDTNPNMVLGSHSLKGTMYSANEYTVMPLSTNINEDLQRAMDNLPQDIYETGKSIEQLVSDQERTEFVPDRKNGSFYIDNKKGLMQVGEGKFGAAVIPKAKGIPGGLFKTHIKLIEQLVPMKEKALEVLDAQINGKDSTDAQRELNDLYDAFYEKNGSINRSTIKSRTNLRTGKRTETEKFHNLPRTFFQDPEGVLVTTLDSFDSITGKSKKGLILTGTVLEPSKPPVIETASDALAATLNEKGYVDVTDIADKLNMTEQDATDSLGDMVFFDPVADVWETRDEYLSGKVRLKLKEAEVAAKSDPAFKRNVDELEKVQPTDILPSKITARMGNTWVPVNDVMDFTREELGVDTKITFIPVTNTWVIESMSVNDGALIGKYSTSRRNIKSLLRAALNQEQVNVYDNIMVDGKKKRELNAEATELARAKLQDMKAAFMKWVWVDPERSERLSSLYNTSYNDIVPRKYDGSHLVLPGVSSQFQLRPHQLRVVWRIMQSGNTYMAHTVGAGKTMAAVAAGMEQKRLGLIKKPMYVVPNHMLNQFSKEFLELYPSAKILIADEESFHGTVRHKFVARSATEPWDAIIMTHSSFGLISAPPQFEESMIQKELELYRDALENIPEEEAMTRKRMEKLIEQKEQNLESAAQRVQDAGISFEQMGVDHLVIDEAHEFRKLSYATSQGSIKGIDSTGSNKAWDLYVKSQYLNSINPGRSLVMMSGTPVTNTIGELYTLQRYLQGDMLESKGLSHFDAWAGQFADTRGITEQTPSGGYKVVTRLSKFVNAPELLRMFRDVADVVISKDLDGYVTRPQVSGGKMELVTVESTPLMKEYQKDLGRRMGAIEKRKGPPKKGDDILLAVITDGRHAAIDDRYIDPSAPADNPSKLNKLISDVVKIYHDTTRNQYFDPATGEAEPLSGSTIMIFSNLGVTDTRGFSAYQWMKESLIKQGVPEEEIAFIQDYKKGAAKLKLFSDMNSGRKRILIGSSAMETGVNAQQRLIAMRHLDAPWFPASMEQRRGRMIRQGNKNKEVYEAGYATKGTYDSTMFGMLETKQGFIDQMWSDDFSIREMEDVGGDADQYAIAKALASGDERLIQKVGLEQDVSRLMRLRNGHLDDQHRAGWQKSAAMADIESLNDKIKDAEADIEKRVDTKGDKFHAMIDGKRYTDRKKAGAAILSNIFDAYNDKSKTSNDYTLGDFGGFELTVWIPNRRIESNGRPGERAAWPEIQVDVAGIGPMQVTETQKPLGIFQSIESSIKYLENRIGKWQEKIKTNKVKSARADAVAGTSFDREEEFQEKSAKLEELTAEILADTDTGDDAPLFTMDSDFSLVQGKFRPSTNEWSGEGNWHVVTPGTFVFANHPKDGFSTREDAEAWMAEQDANNIATDMDRQEPGAQFSRSTTRPFYSELTAQVEAIKQEKAPVLQWKAMLNKLGQKGVKQAEIDWSGINEWLAAYPERFRTQARIDAQKAAEGEDGMTFGAFAAGDKAYENAKVPNVTKQEIVDYLKSQEVQVEEVALGSEGKWSVVDDDGEISRTGYASLKEAMKSITADEKAAGFSGNNLRQEASDTSYEDYQMAGASSGYRELLLSMPSEKRNLLDALSNQDLRYILEDQNVDSDLISDLSRDGLIEEVESWNIPERSIIDLVGDRPDSKTYASPHWDVPNVLAHIRFNERTIDGKRTMFVEEIQSDWAQAGRKEGFANAGAKQLQDDITVEWNDWLFDQDLPQESIDDIKFTGIELNNEQLSDIQNFEDRWDDATAIDRGITDMPFKTTESWAMLAMKRVIRYAAENGFEQVSWTPGEVQNARYDLSKQVDEVIYYTKERKLVARKNTEAVFSKIMDEDEIQDHIGKDAAEKLLSQKISKPGRWTGETERRISGDQLKLGGKGMTGFYDKILPKAVGKFIKKFGSKVGVSGLTQDTSMNSWAVYDATGELIWSHLSEDGAKKQIENEGTEKWSMRDLGESQDVWTFPVTDKMRESAERGFAMFQEKGGNRKSHLTTGRVKVIARDVAVKNGVRPGKIVVVGTERQLPQSVLDQAAEEGVLGQINAVHDGGTIYVVADKQMSQAEVEEALLHELQHLKARKVLGKAINPLFQNLYKGLGGVLGMKAAAKKLGVLDKFNENVRTAAMLVDEGKMDENSRAEYLADEFLALVQGEKAYDTLPGKVIRAIKEFIGAVKDALRRMGFPALAELNDNDVVFLLKKINQQWDKKRGGYKKADFVTSPAQFSRATTADEYVTDYEDDNARLREDDRGRWDRAKSYLKRQLAPGGNLPQSAFADKIMRDTGMEVDEFDIRHIIGKFERAIKKQYKIPYEKLPVGLQDKLYDALTGQLDDSIQGDVRQRLIEMRQHIEKMSTELNKTLLNRVSKLTGLPMHEVIRILQDSQGDPVQIADALRGSFKLQDKRSQREFKESITQSMRMLTIAGNMKTYVHRSYKAFDDPKWFKKLSNEVIDNARSYLRGEYEASGMDPDEAADHAERVIHEMVKTGTAYDSMGAMIQESKLGAKDLSIMKKKNQDLHESILALLGEYRDPRINFAKSNSMMSRLIWNQRFLERVLEHGLGNFMWERKNKPPEATVKFSSEGNETYSPLDGYWVTPEIDQAFHDALDKEAMDQWYRTIVQYNGMVKVGKTILSPTTAMRNWQSALFFSMANGHFDLRESKKAWSGLREYFTQQGDQGKLDYLRKLKQLGVVYDTPYAGEMMRLLADSRMEEMLIGKKGKAVNTARFIMKHAQNFYSYGDDFWKIIGFENEKAALMKHMKVDGRPITEREAEIEAAERVRNVYPTYSMVGRGIKQLRKFPLAGTFVSFPAEIIRTSYHIMRYAAIDMKTPGMRPMAIKRLTGMAMVSSAAFGLQQLSAALLGIDDDEEEAVRLLAAPWQRNSNLWFTGRDENGNLKYFDISFLDPYNYWKRPINAIMRDQPWEDMATDIAAETLKPFFGTDITAGAIGQLYANKTESGKHIYSPHDNPFDQAIDIGNHMRKAVQPGIASNIERTFKAVRGMKSPSGRVYNVSDEAMAWAGWRASTLDPKLSLYYRSFEFKDMKTEATIKLNSVIRNPNRITDRELKSAHKLSSKLRDQAYRDFGKIVHAAERSGLNRMQTRIILKNSGVSKRDINHLMNGTVPNWRPSKGSLRNALRKARALFDRDTQQEFKRRYQIIRNS